MPGPEIPHAISSRLNIQEIIHNSAKQWDGGYAIMGAIGNGDYFCLRDPHGIRPCHYLITDEFIAVASERVPLMTVFEVESEQVQELPPANMLSIKADGTHAITEFTTPLKPAP